MRRAKRRGWRNEREAMADFERFAAKRADREVRPLRLFKIMGKLVTEEISPEEAQAISQEEMKKYYTGY